MGSVNRNPTERAVPIWSMSLQKFYNINTMHVPFTPLYVMRGTLISTGAYVGWTVTGHADTTGSQSGHSGDITNIVVVYQTGPT